MRSITRTATILAAATFGLVCVYNDLSNEWRSRRIDDRYGNHANRVGEVVTTVQAFQQTLPPRSTKSSFLPSSSYHPQQQQQQQRRWNIEPTLPSFTTTSLASTSQDSPSSSAESSSSSSINGGSTDTDSSFPASDSLSMPSSSSASSPSTTAMTTKETEKALRNEIATRNSLVDNEGQYTIRDGAGIIRDVDTTTTTTSPSQDSSEQQSLPKASAAVENTNDDNSFDKSYERLIRQRPYPLFMLEKGVEIVEDTVEGFTHLLDGSGQMMTGSDTMTIVRGSGNDETSSDSSSSSRPNSSNDTRERVVVLGTGWGAAAFVKGIDTTRYDVTVISPRNYFLFTPMLAGASVGTVDYRSITQPIREINRSVSYYEGTATDIDPIKKTISCESVICDGNSCDIDDFTVEYDRLVVTIGAQTNTFGIPGVREHCNFLKEVEDARRIRTAIVNCFERANLPDLTDEERIKGLTFAIIGAGPTGIEFSAELRDFIEQDGPKYYPNLLKFVRIKVIEASSTVLAPFDKSLQDEAISRMKRQVSIKDPAILNLLPERFQLVELLLDSSVKEVTENTIQLNDGNVIDYGLSVWAAGNGPLPLTLQVVDKLGEMQASEQSVARGRIVTDAWMRAKGSKGTILAFGDCSCTTKGPDGPLPATGQVAAQQGEFLAKMMNQQYNLSPGDDITSGQELPPTRNPEHDATLSEQIASFSTRSNNEYAKPFQFLNLGILAYTGGGSALAQVATAPNAEPIKGTGKVGNALWKSVYISKQVSWRNRFMVINDWVRRTIFGRDITRV